MTRLNLSYYEPSDDFYYTETGQVAPEHRDAFAKFYADVVDRLNFLGGEYTVETGEGKFPFHQTMRLYNFSPDQILTNFDAGTTYNFEVTAQGNLKQFSAQGSSLETIADIISLIETNAPVSVAYLPAKHAKIHRLKITSNTAAVNTQGQNTGGGTGGTTQTVSSSVSVSLIANDPHNESDSTTTDGQRATVTIPLQPHDGTQVLTKAPNDSTVVFEFKQGKAKKLSVRGSDAQTYKQLVDTINNSFDTVEAHYRMDGSNKHQILLAFVIPTDAKASDYDYIAEGIKVQPVITDFTGLAQNSQVIHLLEEPIVGGPNLLGVISNTRRGNGEGWGAFVPILNTSVDSKSAITKDADQAPVINKIENESPKEAGLSISDVAGNNGEGIPEESTSSSAVGASLSGNVDGKTTQYENLRDGTTQAPDIDSTILTTAGSVNNQGFDPDALNPDGSVADESKLTPAQKSTRVEQPTKFSN